MTSRRDFLRGRRGRAETVLRPPWAIPAGAFEDCCTRCDECLRRCPTGILVQGDGGFPTVDFSRGECTFCGDCVAACAPHALLPVAGEPAWSLRAQISEACLARQGVECRVCGEACGEGAIRFRPRIGGVALPELDETACTGCGACLAPCPSQAITVAPDLEMIL
jgi:ferredoxin-type protein NapF